MKNLVTEIALSASLGLLILALCVCIIFLFALKYAFFQKIYLFFIEHEDWKVYREVKRMLMDGIEVPILATWSPFVMRKSICFIVSHEEDKRYISVWKNGKCQLTYGFHKPVIEDLLCYGNMEERIKQKQVEVTKEWNEYQKRKIELEQKVIELKTEFKEKFGVDYDEEHPNEI